MCLKYFEGSFWGVASTKQMNKFVSIDIEEISFSELACSKNKNSGEKFDSHVSPSTKKRKKTKLIAAQSELAEMKGNAETRVHNRVKYFRRT